MATTEYILDSLEELDRYVRLTATATSTTGIVDAVRAYLESWSKERILKLQRIDAGWAPFDDDQRPVPILGANDVRSICESVRDQCLAVRASSVALTPELLEIDLFFFFASESLAAHESTRAQAPRPAVPPHHDRGGLSSAYRRHERWL